MGPMRGDREECVPRRRSGGRKISTSGDGEGNGWGGEEKRKKREGTREKLG